MDLEALRDKARAVQERGTADSAGAKRRKRPSRWRVTLWAVEAVVLLAVVEHFLLRPYLAERDRREQAQPLPVSAGALVAALGERAIPLRGLRELTPAYVPFGDGFPDGCRGMQEAQAVVSLDRGLPMEVANSIGMRFRLVPNGTVLMGSPPEEAGRWRGEVQHVRAIPRAFYIGRCEVTQAEWRAVWPERPAGDFRDDRRPVEEVTWFDCQEFLKKLCEREGVPRWTYRLPTEAEWEYACRAGSSTAFFFGDDPARLVEYDFYNENNVNRTAPVGLLKPNGLGLYDMHGNVWEWCSDAFANYPGADTPDDTDGKWRVVRGGSWYVAAADCRSANRARLTPTSHGNMLGLRVVRTLPEVYPELGQEQR